MFLCKCSTWNNTNFQGLGGGAPKYQSVVSVKGRPAFCRAVVFATVQALAARCGE